MFRAVRFVCAVCLLVISPCWLPGLARAEKVLYSEDFEARPRGWSVNETLPMGQGRALGPFNNRHKECSNRVRFRLPDLPPASGTLVLEFDLVLLGRWESEGAQADRFEVRTADQTLLAVTEFPCNLTEDAENLPAGAPGAVAVFNRHLGSCVLRQRLALPADRPLELEFGGSCSGRRSEFWAVDNVRIVAP